MSDLQILRSSVRLSLASSKNYYFCNWTIFQWSANYCLNQTTESSNLPKVSQFRCGLYIKSLLWIQAERRYRWTVTGTKCACPRRWKERREKERRKRPGRECIGTRWCNGVMNMYKITNGPGTKERWQGTRVYRSYSGCRSLTRSTRYVIAV